VRSKNGGKCHEGNSGPLQGALLLLVDLHEIRRTTTRWMSAFLNIPISVNPGISES
jgi:hypothetical protein